MAEDKKPSLQLLAEVQQGCAAKIQRLRDLIQEGLASGSEPMAKDEFEQIKREGRALRRA